MVDRACRCEVEQGRCAPLEDHRCFQIHRHTSSEKDFLDDDQIKAADYAEHEQMLKDVYVPPLL